MKRFHWVSISFTLVACAAMVLPHSVVAETTTTASRPTAMALDVSLHRDGVLVGQVLSPQGKRQIGVEVLLVKNGQAVARGVTDDDGLFGVSGIAPGQYALATESGQVAVRAWDPAVAPPNVAVGALLVDGDVARAQCHCNGSSHATVGHGQQYVTVQPPLHVQAPATAVQVPAPAYNGTFVSDPSATYAGSASGGYTGAVSHAAASQCQHRGVAGGRRRRGLLGFGLLGGNGAGTIGAAPILAGGAIAAAVAIPVALDDDDDDAS